MGQHLTVRRSRTTKTSPSSSTIQEAGRNQDAQDDDDIMIEPPKRTGGRRTGISAEPIKEDDTEYKKVVIPKDEATRKSLEAAMSKNLLFAHLEEDEAKTMFDAMFPVEKQACETIIEQGEEGDNFYVIDKGVRLQIPVIIVHIPLLHSTTINCI
ncbi:hypothetical protein NECAME_13681 [Necator americanus]|uniref:Cyclic nucleotide-binding domain-containing protein n=1 Tax=Necator americanus TaxID=51031 RepID=W2SW45_NECAM|nr:hypothetical protein NECAME_13681 [Necator americanus]ETN72922.1 hypothetical protein NECAME_13681 [Necator americanus]